MRIERITAHAVTLRFAGGGFSTSYGTRTALANVLLAVHAGGLTGYGEVCQFKGVGLPPLDPANLAETEVRLAPLIGADVRDILAVGDRLGEAPDNLRCAVDIALHDLFGRRIGEPVVRLLGGDRAAAMRAYLSVGSGDPADMARHVEIARQQGVNRFQVKLDGERDAEVARVRAVAGDLRRGEVVLADANGAYDIEGARRVMAATSGLDVLFEEPCASYEENLELARGVDRPVVLDQCLGGLVFYARAVADRAFAGVGIKLTNLGGAGPARIARDLSAAAGLMMKIDDSWAGDTGSVACLHVAAGAPPALSIAAVDMRDYFEGAMFEGGPETRDGAMVLPDSPGLGLEPLPGVLDAPLFELA